MKIVHLVHSLDSGMGGLPQAVIGMAAAQFATGHEVTVAAVEGVDQAETLQQELIREESLNSFSVVLLPRVTLPWRSSSLDSALDSLEADWLQVHGLWEPVLHAAMRWAGARYVPYGVTPHAMLHPWQCRHHRISKRILRKLCGVEALWGKAECLHALTSAEAEHWKPVVAEERIHVIPNGIDPDSDPGESGQGDNEFRERPYLLFMGRLAAQKNPESLLEAFGWIADEFPDLQLVFAGPDYGQAGFLRREVEAFGLSERVHFTGRVEGQKKWDLLHGCTAFCLPSRGEGFSLAVLEAGLAGAPCLISAECGFPELVQAGGAVEVSLHSETLAMQLKEVLGDPQKLPEMGTRAQELIRERYTWSHAAEKLNRMMAGSIQLHH